MKNKIEKLIVFDLDGTLSQSNLSSLPAIQDTQKELGYKVSDYDTLLGIYGAPFEEFFEVIFPNADEETIKRYYAQIPISEKKFIHLSKPFEKIPQTIDKLKQNGFTIAVCSNADRRYISTTLEALKILDKVDYIQELEENMTSKTQSLGKLIDKLNPKKTIMVGDTAYDYKAARDNKVEFIGCVYGFRPSEMEKVENKANNPEDIYTIAKDLTE